jgi:hypothetical protein
LLMRDKTFVVFEIEKLHRVLCRLLVLEFVHNTEVVTLWVEVHLLVG